MRAMSDSRAEFPAAQKSALAFEAPGPTGEDGQAARTRFRSSCEDGRWWPSKVSAGRRGSGPPGLLHTRNETGVPFWNHGASAKSGTTGLGHGGGARPASVCVAISLPCKPFQACG